MNCICLYCLPVCGQGEHTELAGSLEWEKAQRVLQDNSVFHDLSASLPASTSTFSASTASHISNAVQLDPSSSSSSLSSLSSLPTSVSSSAITYAVAVYGASVAAPGTESWQLAFELGKQLALHKFHQVLHPHVHTQYTLNLSYTFSGCSLFISSLFLMDVCENECV